METLHNARNENLPSDAHLIASRDGASAVYIPLTDAETDRVTTAAVNAAARSLNDTLAGDLLLLFTNQTGDQFHIIRPDLSQARPRLQRMVARRGEHHRTVVQQLANMWDDYGRNGQSVHQSIVSAFSVEPVTELFFNEYRRIFGNAKNEISGFTDERELHLFTQTLFNRLMFVYFISRKGWLKFNGNTDYLNALWHAYRSDASQTNFYITRLQPFFFSGLNNPQARDLSKNDPVLYALIGDVEFLNGGLFEKGRLDRRENVIVPDGVIEPILTDLFDRFNFTVTESTPYDTEVAVDPEMLGKVFEELVNERHESGAYYTPRPVVSFMCREALKGYIASRHPELDPDSIAAFVDDGRGDVLPRSIKASVATSLDEVTTVDPACGSGAYLLGMLQELISLRDALFNESGEADPRDEYQRKLHIISRNLYGADIDDFAVNIAMLRLWLSLVIEYEGDKPEALPNLDFKIACGDSLLAPDPDPQKYGDFTAHLMRESDVAELKAEYMRARTQGDKDRLRDKISEAQAQIEDTIGDAARAEGAIDWRVEFAEVMGSGGFDIVVANPPYVRYQNIGIVRNELIGLYPDGSAGNSDLYCYFYIRALQLLRKEGMHVFVCSNSWLDVAYGIRLQDFLFKNAHLCSIYESAVERQFSTAQINTLVSIIRKTKPEDEQQTRFVSLKDKFDSAISDPAKRLEMSFGRKELARLSYNRRGRTRFEGYKWGSKISRAPNIFHLIMQKGRGKFVRVGEIGTVKLGMTTGANGFFYLTDESAQEWGIEARFLQPVITSPRDSQSIILEPTRLPYKVFMCHESKENIRGTRAYDYISWGESEGIHRRPSCASRRQWWDLGNREISSIAMNELIDTTARINYTEEGIYFDKNFDIIVGHEIPASDLCTFMNSTVFQLMIHTLGRENFGGGLLRMVTHELARLPVMKAHLTPRFDDDEFSRIFNTAAWDVLNPSSERRELDNAIFDALELTQGERDAVYEGVSDLVGNRMRRARSV